MTNLNNRLGSKAYKFYPENGQNNRKQRRSELQKQRKKTRMLVFPQSRMLQHYQLVQLNDGSIRRIEHFTTLPLKQ